MRINNNMLAMNTHRQMGITGGNQSKAMEKLSSGLRINRAGDDAAGLSISEKMRGQIRGLNMASKNAQDGISMIQTAEGALNETQAILQRMRELAVQSGNDTNVNELDRESMQNEFTKLKEEIDRIGNTTEFNTQSLLKGDGKANLEKTNIASVAGKMGDVVAGATTHTGATATVLAVATTGATGGTSMTFKLNGQELTVKYELDSSLAATAGKIDTDSITGNSVTIKYGGGVVSDADNGALLRSALTSMISENTTLSDNYDITGAGVNVIITANSTGDFAGAKGFIGATGAAANIAGAVAEDVGTTVHTQATTTMDFSGVTNQAGVDDLIGKGITIGDTQFEFYNADKGAYTGNAVGINISAATTGTGVATALANQLPTNEGYLATAAGGVLTLTSTVDGKAGNDTLISKDGGVQKDFQAKFQIGANENQEMEINIGDMRSEALGIKDVDLGSRDGAKTAITTINDAINKVSEQRSALGAFQNRLEHTIKNLDNSAENLQAAESRIRDVDMAKEMMNLTKQNILQQASQAMMAQANSAPQGVLQLLR
ncbi:flagellin [Acetoanaerobium noterae]|uniref:flagellin N-terminal helical domain-containing protein n=1 Tax=Acetoanaerobium noterae TaxID=745369 RepID=UPI0028AEB97A|nr:flagellin [Acetoanaerobium noterae]